MSEENKVIKEQLKEMTLKHLSVFLMEATPLLGQLLLNKNKGEVKNEESEGIGNETRTN